MIDKCYVIPVQKLCNANCKFCISKSRNYSKEQEFLEPNEEFIETIKLLTKRKINRYEITGGGEPFLNPNLDKIISLIKQINPNSFIKVYTNGRILKSIYGIDELNISVASLDKTTNDEIMGKNDNYTLKEKLDFFSKSNNFMKIRLSIALVKGGIDSKEKLQQLISETKNYGIHYVVRTLYPHTKNIENDYVDFGYENELVTFERNNGVDDFDGIILWSDGKIYTNWELKDNRKLYSYILLKPDSKERYGKITDYIRSKGFSIKSIMHTSDFVNFASKLYSDKESDYFSKVKRHLENTSYLFGNEGLIIILDKEVDYQTLIEETYSLKKELRSLFSFTGFKNGFLLIDENISHLNIVHAPDPIRSNYERDIRYIESANLRKISSEEESLILKYRSYHI